MNELQLPNPGDNRYWDIGVDISGDYTLTLRTQEGKLLAECDVYKSEASQAAFTELCNMLIVDAQNKANFVGQYKFEETN